MTDAIPVLGGALLAAGGAVWALVERVRAVRARAEAASWHAKFDRAAADAETAADGERAARARAEDLRVRLDSAGRLKTDRIVALEGQNARLVRVLASLDPAAAALAVADPLDRVLSQPPASRAANRGAGTVRPAAASPSTLPAKGH